MITSRLVPEHERMEFLPSKLPGHSYLAFEAGAFNKLGSMSDYIGGYWKFYDLDNGGFYIAPSEQRRYAISVYSNGYEGEMSADAAGIVASLYSLNALCWIYPTVEVFCDRFYQLRDFAGEHAEASAIYGAID